jgi:hypothetical protein
MARIAAANYTATGTDFEYATADGDELLPDDLRKLGRAVNEHTHDSTRGVAVRRLDTATNPAAAGHVQISADALRWWGASAAGIKTAVDLDSAQAVSNKSISSSSLTSPTITTPAITGGTISGSAISGGSVTGASFVTPTIASFVNATHTHQNAAGGGALDAAAITGSVTGSGSVVKATSPTVSAPTVSGGLGVSAGGIALSAGDPATQRITTISTGTTTAADAQIHLDRSTAATHSQWIRFGSGVAYDLFLGRKANSDSLVTRRWDGNASVDLLSLTPVATLGLGVTPSAWGSLHNAMQVGALSLMGETVASGGPQGMVLSNAYWDGSDFRAVRLGESTRLTMQTGGFGVSSAATSSAGQILTYFQRLQVNQYGVSTGSDAQHNSWQTGVYGQIALGNAYSQVYGNSIEGTCLGYNTYLLAGVNKQYANGAVGSRLTVAGSLVFSTFADVGQGGTQSPVQRFIVTADGNVSMPSIPAFQAGDKYLVRGADGSVRVSSLGPAS